MRLKRKMLGFRASLVCLLATAISSGVISEQSENEKQEYQRDMARIKAFEKSLKPGPFNDLQEYERFADEIHKRWSQKNKENNARLVLELCRGLSSGQFRDHRSYDLARKYALSVLEKPEAVPVEMELELTGHVMTTMSVPGAPKGEEFAHRRVEDVEIRLHAWRRLMDSVDPNWDPNELLWSPNTVGAELGIPISGMSPESVKDPELRAKYEAALQQNQEKIKRHTQQRRLHDSLKWYPKWVEEYAVLTYSEPPYNIEEISALLKQFMPDERIGARILDAVNKNMQTPPSPDIGSAQTSLPNSPNGQPSNSRHKR
jgi:hypothetical protein